MSGPEILIFDDDPAVGSLMLGVMEDAGYQTQLYGDGTRVISLVQEIRPRLVILDIMLPGVDGLSSCKALRALPGMKDLRIIVTSAKSAGQIEALAGKVGADQFIPKPFTVLNFIGHVQRLIGASTSAEPTGAADPIFVTVLGSRSAGKTSCVALELGEALLILDAGSGLADIGKLIEGRKGLNVLLTHYHEDHVSGLSALRDLDIPLTICGPSDVEMPLADVAKKYLNFPPKEGVTLYTLVEGTFTPVFGVKVSALYVNHGATAVALRIDTFGKKIVYCPDNEIRPPREGQIRDIEDKLRAFARDADLFIHDARYAPEDFSGHVNDGHSSFDNVVDLAVDAGAARLLLFHLDASYSEEKMTALVAAARARAASQITALDVSLAQEGVRLKI
jgi:CheY-like chemotaxis protein